MKRHLTPKDEKRIIKIIENWSEPKLTWPLLLEACKEKLGIERTRQALMNLPAVNMAMKDKKEALKVAYLKPGWIKDINEANERIEKLTKDNQQLKAICDQLFQRFILWQHNAGLRGMTEAMLDRPRR